MSSTLRPRKVASGRTPARTESPTTLHNVYHNRLLTFFFLLPDLGSAFQRGQCVFCCQFEVIREFNQSEGSTTGLSKVIFIYDHQSYPLQSVNVILGVAWSSSSLTVSLFVYITNVIAKCIYCWGFVRGHTLTPCWKRQIFVPRVSFHVAYVLF